MTTETVDKARINIAEGMNLVKNRQKLVKLADSTDLGWRVDQEYESNPLADDSDDEKKMIKAQSRAERKFKAEKTKRNAARSHPYGQASTSRAHTSSAPGGPPGLPRTQARQMLLLWRKRALEEGMPGGTEDAK